MARVEYSYSLAAKYPSVAAQWLYPTAPRYVDLTPADVTPGSGIEVMWKCPKGPDHEWPAKIYSRTKLRSGCPCCAGIKASVTNCLGSLFPTISEQWHPTKNGDLTPDQVAAGSNQKYWWKCPEGPDHEWQNSPSARTSKPRKGGGKGRGCPFCANQRVSVTNSLASLFPEVAAELHPEKNNGVTTDQIIAGSTKQRVWRCRVNPEHEWTAKPESRTGPRKSGCPDCRIRPQSKVAIYIAFELARFVDVNVDESKVVIDDRIWDVDIIVRNLLLIIEFDGHYFHKDRKEADIKKTKILTNAGWTVIHLREKPLEPLSTNDVTVPQPYTDETLKKAAVLALKKIENVTGKKLEGFAKYQEHARLVSKTRANQHIDKLLREDDRNRFKINYRLWMPFPEMRDYVRSLGLSSTRDFLEWLRSDEKPSDIPGSPWTVYPEYVDIYDLCGYERRTFWPFSQVRDYVRSKGFKSVEEFRQWAKTAERPTSIPSSPEAFYADSGFVDFYDLLGIRKPPELTVELILSWAKQHEEETGQWPASTSGQVIGQPSENWNAVNAALGNGHRGLPGGSSVAKLLDDQLGKRNFKRLPGLTEELILKLADEHYERTSGYPDTQSGSVIGLTGDTWGGINGALQKGGRGLPGGDSLFKLLKRHGRKKKIRRTYRPNLTEDMIWEWMKAHHARGGRWPSAAAGKVIDAPGETWGSLNTCLQGGLRGLPGRSSLKELRVQRLSMKDVA